MIKRLTGCFNRVKDNFMLNNILFKICLLALIIFNLSFTWPLENIRITSTFGESRGDHFHDGIDIISGNFKIHPAEDGELVYFWNKSLFPTENYPGGGNFKVLTHKNGYSTIYMHLEDSSEYKKGYSVSDTVAEMGLTGHSSGKHLHFTLYNTKMKKFINPLTVFPQITDKMNPIIEGVYIRIEDKYFRINNNNNIKLTHNYPLLVEIWDTINKGDRLGIYKLVMTLNGEKIADNIYSEISFSKNCLNMAGKTFQELFDEKGYYKATNVKYIQGVNELLITAVDYSGNETSKKISFAVNLDTQ